MSKRNKEEICEKDMRWREKIGVRRGREGKGVKK
jgi:hypothetical protein